LSDIFLAVGPRSKAGDFVSSPIYITIRAMRQLVPTTISVLLLILGAFLPGCAATTEPSTQPTSRTTASGLTLIDVKQGDGDLAGAGDTVSVHYTGKFANGTKFDSSYDRNQPFEFVLGQHQVIAGWDEGVAGMKVGGKRQLIIPPDLAYGPSGTPDGSIPPNSTLYFDVELLAVTHH
jgi:FKBP-type peptidyl-prolyl cis-trans isomerase